MSRILNSTLVFNKEGWLLLLCLLALSLLAISLVVFVCGDDLNPHKSRQLCNDHKKSCGNVYGVKKKLGSSGLKASTVCTMKASTVCTTNRGNVGVNKKSGSSSSSSSSTMYTMKSATFVAAFSLRNSSEGGYSGCNCGGGGASGSNCGGGGGASGSNCCGGGASYC
ncbi:uncharacterized protein A4U43_C05F21650 [Asparagus officinalis]|uniref:Uncharacterized protein n=1 Tax=Asparagus officinalis TaxID=4686 RepID=A0A5P1EUS0_ASPOF|nr:loricrin-like [Asparagus officinalis]ONK69323.1 uncharacterized protein A4U43_C05F21650 [Asparagus officinalis]